jgi:hypothetical protein
MVCDYYVQSDLVIVYYDNQGTLSTTRTNRILEKGYIFSVADEDSDEDEEIKYKKWKEELKRRVERNTYKKILYDNDNWIKESYEKKYSKELNIICPRMIKIVKVYKDYYAWERY